jgi:hypothetical protein
MKTTTAGGLLRDARQALELTLKAVGECLDPPVSAAYVSDVELGRRPLTAERLPQFIKVLKLDAKASRKLYCAAGILPDSLSTKISKAPELWDANFKALAVVLPDAISALRSIKPAIATQLENAANIASLRENTSTR